MAEYIEREALMEQLGKKKAGIADKRYTEGFNDALMRFRSMVHSAKAADVVEVPCRCKDCKHWMDFPNCGCTDFVKVCALAEYMIGANGYCLYGERKDGE